MKNRDYSSWTLEALYQEEKKLNETFFAPKIFYPTLIILLLSFLLAMYAMKDRFSYTLSIIVLISVYFFIRQFINRSQIRKAIKARHTAQ